jgi:hypothetical protein
MPRLDPKPVVPVLIALLVPPVPVVKPEFTEDDVAALMVLFPTPFSVEVPTPEKPLLNPPIDPEATP